MVLLFALAACQNEEKVETPAALVEQHESVVSTQAVKKDEIAPAVVQKDIEKSTQTVVDTLAEGSEAVNPCSVKEAMPNNPCAVKEVMNPCAAKQAAINPCTAEPAVVINPCAVKKVVNPCTAKQAIANPCTTAEATVVINPCSVKKVAKKVIENPCAVKVTTNFTGKCKACHKVDKDAVGPSFKKIQAAYGSSAALAKVFESGFTVDSRKVAASDAKYKKKVGMMTSQYKKLIKKKVEAGKFTYQALADEIFSK